MPVGLTRVGLTRVGLTRCGPPIFFKGRADLAQSALIAFFRRRLNLPLPQGLYRFTFSPYRHSADKWADRAESALPLLIFLFLKDFIVSRLALAAIRRISGRIRLSPPYRF